MTSLPRTMRLIHPPDQSSPYLRLLDFQPLPQPTHDDDHLVLVHAAAPCRHELTWELADPHIFPHGRSPPRVPCTDGAGTIITAPPNSPFSPNSQVFFNPSRDRALSLAEYTLVRTDEMAVIPRSLGLVEAASVPLSALTAWQGLFVHGNVDVDEKVNGSLEVLVTGAAGGVGAWVVQLAKAAGVGGITAVYSASKGEVPTSAGATKVLSYEEFPSSFGDVQYDLVFDTVGGDVLRKAWSVVGDDESTYVLSVSNDQPDDMRPAGSKTVRKSEWFLVEHSGKQLEGVAELIDQGKCKALVDSVYEFDEFEKAFERVDSGKTKGKVVIKVP